MSKAPFSKLQSSLSLEDLLAQPSPRNSQNWLLTYLDVFVLVVMLVIMLITLNDFNIEQQQAASKSQVVRPKKAPAAACPPLAENKDESSNIKNEAKESNSIIVTPVTTPEVKSAVGTATNAVPNPAEVKQPTADAVDENKLQQQLTKTIDDFGLSKAVNIKLTEGYAQLEIQDKVLFRSSEAELTTSGQVLLKRLAPVLKKAVGLILIEGHTDNIPIKTAKFPSNWELGASRATSVLHFLVAQQLEGSHLRAISYADTMPIADNSTPEGREKNRRVNLLIKFSEQ